MHLSAQGQAYTPSNLQKFGDLSKEVSAQRLAEGLSPVADGTLGIPTTPLPQSAISAIRENLNALEAHPSPIQYTHFQGAMTPRAEMAELFSQDYGLPTTADDILFTVGNTSGLNTAIHALGGPIITTRPHYPTYRALATKYGREFLPAIDLKPTGFQLTAEAVQTALEGVAAEQHVPLAELHGTLVLNLPGNPASTAPAPEEMKKIADLLKPTTRLNLVFDDVYGDAMLERDAEGQFKPFEHLLSFAPELAERSLVLRTFSKDGLGGERIGILRMPADAQLRSTLCGMHFDDVVHAPYLGQLGSVAVYRELVQNKQARQAIAEHYEPKVAFMRGRLKELGADAMGDSPTHGFITIGDLHELIGQPMSLEAQKLRRRLTGTTSTDTTIRTDTDLALQLLADPDNPVAVTPMSDFGMAPEDGMVRISCSGPDQALARIADGIQSALTKSRRIARISDGRTPG